MWWSGLCWFKGRKKNVLDSERKGGLFKWPSQVIMLVSGTSRQALLQMGRSRTCLGVPGPLLAILSSMVWALLQCGGVLSPSECSFISGGTIVVELILLLAVYWGCSSLRGAEGIMPHRGCIKAYTPKYWALSSQAIQTLNHGLQCPMWTDFLFFLSSHHALATLDCCSLPSL